MTTSNLANFWWGDIILFYESPDPDSQKNETPKITYIMWVWGKAGNVDHIGIIREDGYRQSLSPEDLGKYNYKILNKDLDKEEHRKYYKMFKETIKKQRDHYSIELANLDCILEDVLVFIDES